MLFFDKTTKLKNAVELLKNQAQNNPNVKKIASITPKLIKDIEDLAIRIPYEEVHNQLMGIIDNAIQILNHPQNHKYQEQLLIQVQSLSNNKYAKHYQDESTTELFFKIIRIALFAGLTGFGVSILSTAATGLFASSFVFPLAGIVIGAALVILGIGKLIYHGKDAISLYRLNKDSQINTIREFSTYLSQYVNNTTFNDLNSNTRPNTKPSAPKDNAFFDPKNDTSQSTNQTTLKYPYYSTFTPGTYNE